MAFRSTLRPSAPERAFTELGRRRLRIGATIAALVVLFGVLRSWLVAAFEDEATRLARALGTWLEARPPLGDEPFDPPPEGQAESWLEGKDGGETEPEANDDASALPPRQAPLRPSKVPAGRNEKQDPGVSPTIFLPAARVLDLALSGASPRGVPWRGKAPGQMGVALRGVEALGIGLREGDVLVRVGGRPVGDTAAVIALVLEARGRKEPVIAGEVERPLPTGAVQRLRVVVEQPYPTREELERRLTGNQGSLGWTQTP